MIPHNLFAPLLGRRLGQVALGIAVLGLSHCSAQDRGNGGAAPPQERGGGRDTGTTEPSTPATSHPGPSATPISGSIEGSSWVNPSEVDGSGRFGRDISSRRSNFHNYGIVMRPCKTMPDSKVWERRDQDILSMIQLMARRGSITVQSGGDAAEFTGVSDRPAGWTAYEFRVPPGENIQVRLNHSNEGWFHLRTVNKWGDLEPGMLQNLIPTGNPEVKYRNPTDQPRCVYVIVDDPGWMSTKANPFSMKVARSWDPAKVKIDTTPIVNGIWAVKKVESKASPATFDAKGEVPPETQPKG